MATNTATETRGRGRPKSNVSLRIEKSLLTDGRATTAFGGKSGATEALARMRLYTAARRLNLDVSTTKVERGAVRYIEATVRDAEAAPESAPEAETVEA